MSDKLIEHIQKSPLVQAAITEAVHRFFNDRICSKNPQDLIDLDETQCKDILSTLWNLNPNWRYVIQKTGKRYLENAPNTNSVSIFGKPKKIVTLNFKIKRKKTLWECLHTSTVLFLIRMKLIKG